jgi:hypothetical protein
VSPEPQAGSSADLFVEQLTELLDAHVTRPRPATGEARADETPADAENGEAAGVALLTALGAESTWAEPPADLRDLVLARVLGRAEPGDDDEDLPDAAAVPEAVTTEVAAPEAERQADDKDAATEVEEPPGAGTGVATVHQLRPRWQRLRYAVPAAAAAAAVFTVAVLGVQQALEQGEPAGVTYSAFGTRLAPEANGTVTVAKAAAGFSVVIDVHDLPAAEPGSYYIAWLRGPDGVVPLGSFHARQIAKPITLWSGVDPAQYTRFSVTLQREGAPPTPSGVTVMSGDLR